MSHPIMNTPDAPLYGECYGFDLWVNTLNHHMHDNDGNAQPYCDTGNAARGQ
jgi:hypothetical protein